MKKTILKVALFAGLLGLGLTFKTGPVFAADGCIAVGGQFCQRWSYSLSGREDGCMLWINYTCDCNGNNCVYIFPKLALPFEPAD